MRLAFVFVFTSELLCCFACPPYPPLFRFTPMLCLQERARKAAAHPTLDWLYPVLAAVQGLEEALLVPPQANQQQEPPAVPAWSSAVADKASLGVRPTDPACSLHGCSPLSACQMVAALPANPSFRVRCPPAAVHGAAVALGAAAHHS